MNKTLFAMLILALALGLTGGVAFAEDADPESGISFEPPTSVDKPAQARQNIVDFAPVHHSPDGVLVPLPMPIEPLGASSTSPGGSLGSAIGPARGGTMSTPKQQADREIRRLIRKLG